MRDLAKLIKLTSSKKRIHILTIMEKYSYIGYTRLFNEMNDSGMKIGSSEIYKHLKVLIDLGLILTNQERKYEITEKGNKVLLFVDSLCKILRE